MRDSDLIAMLRTSRERLDYLDVHVLLARRVYRSGAAVQPSIRAGGGSGTDGATSQRGSHSDPTGDAVAASGADPVLKERWIRDAMDAKLRRADQLLAEVELTTAKLLRPPADPRPQQKPLAGCRSCARNGGHFEEVAEGRYRDLCRRCGDYRAAEGRIPPLGAVEYMHRTGRRWTTKVIAEALRAEREQPSTGRRRKRGA